MDTNRRYKCIESTDEKSKLSQQEMLKKRKDPRIPSQQPRLKSQLPSRQMSVVDYLRQTKSGQGKSETK